MLQGIWVNSVEGDVAFRAKGDTLFYPDTTSMPVKFRIIGDTLELQDVDMVKYPVIKQTENLFQFRNQNGDVVSLKRSEDPVDAMSFRRAIPHVLNQNKLIKKDTVIFWNSERYHIYTQVNPTTYKVIKTSYNDEGVEVSNVYYDNIINLAIFNGARRLYSSDFHKSAFKSHVPAEFLSQSVLSDMTFEKADADGLHSMAYLGIPDSQANFIVEVLVSWTGKMTLSVKE